MPHPSHPSHLGRWPGDPGLRPKNMITKTIGLASQKPIINPNILLTTSTNFSFVGPTDVPSQGHVNAVNPQYKHLDKNDTGLWVTFPPCISSKHGAINLLPSNAWPVRCYGAVSSSICLPSAQSDLQNSVGVDRTVTGSGYC